MHYHYHHQLNKVVLKNQLVMYSHLEVIEIYQTTDWCNEEDIEIPYEETEDDLKRYNLSLAEKYDSDMPFLSSEAYRFSMHHFNENLAHVFHIG